MNDLVIIDKIEQKLQEPREENTFPLTPTHRKELRKLRNENVGNLQERLKTIKQLKKEEYEKKYSKQIQKELKKKENVCVRLNKDWKMRLSQINDILEARKELEEASNISHISLVCDYASVAKLERIKSSREYSIQHIKVAKKIANEEFEEKYQKKFEQVQFKIDSVITKYEEAINFGDLNIVKQLYYIMKKADNFFIKIEKLEI